MRFQFFILITVFVLAFVFTGCPGGAPTTNGNQAVNSTPKTETNNNSNSATTTIPKTPEPTSNDAPTLKPVFTAYCDAMTRKDEAAIRRVYSAATLKQFEADMKEENEKSLAKFLEIDQVSNKLCEIKNEKIEGSTATALIKTEGMPNGNVRIKFVKENGEWKLTNEAEDFKSVENATKNANAAK